MPSLNKPRRSIQGLGEVALRVRDLDTMQDFYERVVGLELMKRFRASAFFKIDEGYGGTRVYFFPSRRRASKNSVSNRPHFFARIPPSVGT